MRRRMPRRRKRAHARVSKRNLCAILERLVLEIDAGPRRQVRGRSRRLDEKRQAGDVIRLYMRLEDRDDRCTGTLRFSQIRADERFMWIDHSELALGQAAEQIRGAGRLRVQERTQNHARRLRRHRRSR
jgi:hypothetical protein